MNDDPAMAEIMRRMFRRRQPGEARQMFPMPAEPPPLMVLGQAVPPPATPAAPPMPEPLVALPAPPPGPMPGVPMGDMPPPVAQPQPVPQMPGMTVTAPRRHPLAPAAGGGADELNALVLALLQGQGGQGDTQERLRAAMGMASNAPLAPGVG